MKNLIYWSFIITILTLSACSKQNIPDQVTQIIEEVKQEFAPDKRVALFSIEAEKAGRSILLRGETNMASAKKALLEKLAKTPYALNDEINILPEKKLKGKHYGVVNLSVCNIRSQAKHSAELATQSTLGTLLKVYKEQNSWYLVQTPDGYLGWLDSGGFSIMDEVAFTNWQESKKVVFLPDFGYSFAEANKNTQKISDLVAGNILIANEEQNDFQRVTYPDGRTAFLPKEAVMDYNEWLSRDLPSVENIIKTAFEYMGRPYLWGGTSSKAMDCSGFTKTVYYLNGLLLPRDASQQVHAGIEVPTDTSLVNLLPGDFLFFGRKATEEKKERITHVAIYLGNGKMIHAAGKVNIQSLKRGDSDFAEARLRSFVRAKRMFSEKPEEGVTTLKQSPYYGS